MLDRILTRRELQRVIDWIARGRRVVGPVKRDGHFFYEPVENPDRLDLEFTYCVFSPKTFLTPPRDTLLTFDVSNGKFTAKPVFDAAALALIGVHPCDINAIRLLTQVFTGPPEDEHYLTRRRNTFILGIDCPRPCAEGVFCADMKGNEANEGFDLMCHPLDSDPRTGETVYGVRFGSESGRESVLYARVGRDATPDDETRLERYRIDKEAAFPHVLACDVDELKQVLDVSYESPVWAETASRCYSCGSCNLVCPTCYCFDLRDELDWGGRSGRRIRDWDGCQTRDFALVAGEHNFRKNPAARLRHRIMRKGRWIELSVGLPGCTGCARCDRACTAKINSVEIYNALTEETRHVHS